MTHRCPTCRWEHQTPKPRRAVQAVAQCIAFSLVEALAAIQLDGPIAVMLWAIAVWNVIVLFMLVYGLGRLATQAVDQ